VLRKALSGAGLLASFQGDSRLGEAYLREALAIAREQGDEEAEALVLNWLGSNAYGAGDLNAAEAFASESLEMRRRIGDPIGVALALNALGGVYHFRGDLDSAREMFVESLAIKEAQPNANANGIAVSLTNLGLLERDAGRPEAAEAAFRDALDIWERTGDKQRVSVGVHNMALLALDQGRLDEAAVQLVRAHDLARDIGDRMEMAYAMADLVRVDVERGDLEGATAALAASLPRAQTMMARIIVLLALEGAAGLAAAGGDDVLAINLWAAAAANREESGFANMPADQRLVDARMAEARGRLDPETVAAAWADGRAMSVDTAIEAAMALVRAPAETAVHAG
jgi:tetratricopeptide (TPR) repeat protein